MVPPVNTDESFLAIKVSPHRCGTFVIIRENRVRVLAHGNPKATAHKQRKNQYSK
jgi:hypothetical protein